MELEGVVQLQDAHFWTLCTGNYHGTLRLDVKNQDLISIYMDLQL